MVNKNVLIPRPDTEILVEEALKLSNIKKIADLGTGSGCVGLSLLKEWPEAQLWTFDISSKAIDVAKKNAEYLDITDRVQFINEEPTSTNVELSFDLVVSNPPYIEESDTRLAKSVKEFEPTLALFAKEEGLEYYNLWTPWAYKNLNPNGWLMFECGEGQAEKVLEICQTNGFKNLKIQKDLAGIERVVCAQKRE